MLNQSQLLASEVVANATMNRGRGLVGVNSYERELHFSPSQFLEARVRQRGQALWYDACCGEGIALGEASAMLSETAWGQGVEIVGADLVDMFAPQDTIPRLRLVAAAVGVFAPDKPADLLTCVHGLHYLGDKLGFLEHAFALLAPGGLLLAHLDTNNLRLPEGITWAGLMNRQRKRGVKLALSGHVLRLERANALLDFGLTYCGATVSETPNYTGITVIDSWYVNTDRMSGDSVPK